MGDGHAVVRGNVNGNRIEHSCTYQRVIVRATHELPEVAALEGIKILSISYTRVTETEVGPLEDGRLFEHSQRNIVTQNPKTRQF